MTWKRSFWRHAEDGAVAVEAAVTFMALMLLILGSVQFGLVLWNWNTMLLAVEEAGRYAMIFNPSTYPPARYPSPPGCSVATPTLGNCAVAWANQNSGNNFTVTCAPVSVCTSTNPNVGQSMTFTATYTFNFINLISLSRGIQVPLI